MPEPTSNDILSSLNAIKNPVTGEGIVAAGHVEGVVVKQGNIGFSVRIDPQHADACEAMRLECEKVVAALPGVLSVTAVLTAHETAPSMEKAKKAPEKKTPEVFDRIKTVIAVVSGKGGVGKSTVALNLAAALAAKGQTVGFLDADIFGPSAPQMLGIAGNPEVNEDKKLIPVHKHGVLAMSIGFLVPADQPLAWRGPMVQGALLQMLNDVAWPDLDCLVIDLPPGTGDIQLTLAQQIPVTGAVVVTTPQALAVADVRRSIAMLQKTSTPVIGVVENMAWMFAPDGETRLHPFGEGGGELISGEMSVPYLGQLPLDSTLQEATNAGQPVNVFAPDSPATEAFGTLADLVSSGSEN
ncbi:MAG: P-loop NTPase [Parvibaculales bacterium]